LEATDTVARAAVAADFLVGITHEPHLNLLGQELRRAPIEVQVDAILLLCCSIFEIICKPKHARELVAGGRIEISVATACVDRTVPDT
jgi:hypothetical protein